MQPFRGAQWVRPPDGPPVLLLASERVSGSLWRYTYSIAPGVSVSVVTVTAPGAPGPADSILATVVNDLTRRAP